MSDLAYSDLKAAWHTDKIEAMRKGKPIAPAQVHFIISDLCNHDCHFCAYRMSGGFSTELFAQNGIKNPNRMIPVGKCLEILDGMKEIGVKAVQFTGGGEPTVHPHHMTIFRHALDIGLECALVTNGSILRPGWEAILPHFKWIRVSLDAGSQDTYAFVRKVKNSMYRKVLSHVSSLAGAIKAAQTDCLFGVGYVVTLDNWKDLYDGCLMIRETGVPYVRLAAMFSEQGSQYYNGCYDEIRQEIRKAKELETPSFKVVDLFTDRINDLDQGAPDYNFCGYQQFVVYIGGDQRVYRCCTTSYTKHGQVGDLRDQRFKEWFESDVKKYNYEHFDATSCHHCQFNNKNRAINYLLDGSPMHVNFV